MPSISEATIDPVSQESEQVDWRFPPASEALAISSHGAIMNGLCYVAAGAGPHPTVVLLHGYPGFERNLDLAQAIRRAGWNVLFFHYRGAWGSEGTYSVEGALADVHAAVAWLRQEANRARCRADPARLAVVGHSLGAYLAVRAAAEEPDIARVAYLAGAELAAFGRRARASAEGFEWLVQFFAGTTAVRLANARVSAQRLARQPERYDLRGVVPALIGRSLLMIGAARDSVTPLAEHHTPLRQAVAAQDGIALTEIVLDSDHVFSGRRLALARAVVDWLGA